MKLILTEEHFMSQTVNDHYKKLHQNDTGINAKRNAFVEQFVHNSPVTDLGDRRIAFLNAHDIQAMVIGYGNNSPMHFSIEEEAVKYCKIANDELYEASQKYPGRIYGYATLPVADIAASVMELERCVTELGFKGWMLNGAFKNTFFDAEPFFPIFEKAAELNVPVYIHPNSVSDSIVEHYYKGAWSPAVTNIFSGYGLGWHYDAGIHALRIILAGILDKLPDLKLIIGHWGEMLPYYLERSNRALNPQLTGLKHDLNYYFQNNIYTNPSGMFDQLDFEFCLKILNPDHIMWAQDFPYINDTGNQVQTFLENAQIDETLKAKIAYKNAEKLFHI